MERLRSLFSDLNIEYYAALAYSELKEINPHIRKRAEFEPRTAIIYLVPYYAGECKNLSRYAAARDYHIAIREIGEKIISTLKEMYPTSKSRSFGDHSPIDEISAALSAGLGIRGDNGLIINERYGSYIFVGDVLTDIEPHLLGAIRPVKIARCEGCGACKSACPTGILCGEGEDCLSSITQRKGTITPEERSLMQRHNTAWGCDICQEVCPHNASPKLTPLEFFRKDRICELSAATLGKMDDKEFSERAFGWRGRAVVERNIQILSEK